jgi:hypothetical protein
MIVALDLEGKTQSVPDVHDAGVLTRPLQDVGALRGEAPQMDARGLVRAVLGPEGGEESELRVGGVSPDQADDPIVLLVREPVRSG